MPSREIYDSKLSLHGFSQRERIIRATQKDIVSNIVNSPSYKKVFVNESIERYLQIVATDTDNKKRFTTMPNETISLGDVLTWNNMHWLVTQVDFDDEIVRRGEIEQCNRQIKWQNKNTLEIISRWCLCTKPYTSNINDGKTLSTSNREYKIRLPYDNETKQIDLDSRFMLEKINGIPRTYIVTSVDSLTNRYEDMSDNSGFLVWNLTQDQSGRENDNADLWICDYLIPDSPTPPGSNLLKCQIVGKNALNIGGAARTYTAVFYKTDGITEDSTILPKWDIVYPSGYDAYFKSVQNGRSISIAALGSEDLLGKQLVVKLTDTNGIYERIEMQVDLVVM